MELTEPDKPMVEGAETGETAVEKSLINEALAIKAPINEDLAINKTPPTNELWVSAKNMINTNDDQCRPRKKSSGKPKNQPELSQIPRKIYPFPIPSAQGEEDAPEPSAAQGHTAQECDDGSQRTEGHHSR